MTLYNLKGVFFSEDMWWLYYNPDVLVSGVQNTIKLKNMPSKNVKEFHFQNPKASVVKRVSFATDRCKKQEKKQ